MSAMRFFPIAASVAFVLAVPILLFTTNIRFLASDVGYLEGGIRRHDAAESTGIALGELDYAVGAIVRYFEDDAETLRILVFTGGQETTLFSAEETIHMEDVKGLMRTLFRANEVALGFVLAYVAGTVLWSRERSGRDLAKETLAGVGVGAAFGIVVGIIALVGFESAWERLHEIIFTNDFWLLDPRKDRLIQMFPETFWAEATYIVVGMALAEAVVLVGAAGGYLWFTRPPRAEGEDGVEAEREEAGSDEDRAEQDEETLADEEEGREEGAEESGDAGEEEPGEEGEPAEGGGVSDGEGGNRWWRRLRVWEWRRPAAQEEQPQPPPPQAQPPEAPNSGSI